MHMLIFLQNVGKESFQSIPLHQDTNNLPYPTQKSEGNLVLHNQIIVTFYTFQNENITS